MKKLTLLGLCVLIAMQACKKEPSAPVSKPELPPDPIENTPISGTSAGTDPNSQIIYRQVNKPIGYNKHISLDVDADGVSDFNFFSLLIHHDNKPNMYLMVSPKTAKGARVIVQTGEELVINALWTFPLEKDQLITDVAPDGCTWTDALLKGFVTGSSKTPQLETFSGLWIGKTDKFLGIKLKIDGKFHYGWVKLTHHPVLDELTLSSYAYHKVPDQAIAAGRTE